VTELRFGVDVPLLAAPGDDPVARAREAEDLGFDFVSASDHPCGTQPSHETWTTLTWIAARTSRVRVTTRVLGVPYRAPAMVAKMAETLDRISGGRLTLGLGAGYSDDELRAFGLCAPTPGQKVTGLDEAVTIIRGLWREPAFTFRGQHYGVSAADLEPKPAHHIPIWLGTFGHRALEVTGRLADGWIPTLGYAPAEALPVMREEVLRAARAAGRAPESITCALNVEVDLDGAPGAPSVVSGTSAQVVQSLVAFRAMGFTAFNFMPLGAHRTQQVRRLATEVVPTLRAMA
jgi:probable F420-dependent oxidoreductase